MIYIMNNILVFIDCVNKIYNFFEFFTNNYIDFLSRLNLKELTDEEIK